MSKKLDSVFFYILASKQRVCYFLGTVYRHISKKVRNVFFCLERNSKQKQNVFCVGEKKGMKCFVFFTIGTTTTTKTVDCIFMRHYKHQVRHKKAR